LLLPYCTKPDASRSLAPSRQTGTELCDYSPACKAALNRPRKRGRTHSWG